jgi:hypothetical protein
MNPPKRPEHVETIRITTRILSETRSYLQQFGHRHVEGYLCWAGHPIGGSSVEITSCIFPPNWKPADSSSGFLETGIHRVFGMGQAVAQRGELIFAQVHSHPYEAFHSYIDDERPISHRPGFISIVVPRFGFIRMKDLRECKVFEYLGSGRWRELSQAEVRKRFIIVSRRRRFVDKISQWIKKT